MENRTIEVSEQEYKALMISRSLKPFFVGVDVAQGEDIGFNYSKEFEKMNEKMKKMSSLKTKKSELNRFLSFMNNHDNHTIKIHSYSDEKGIDFEMSLDKEQMESAADYLFAEIDVSIEEIGKSMIGGKE